MHVYTVCWVQGATEKQLWLMLPPWLNNNWKKKKNEAETLPARAFGYVDYKNEIKWNLKNALLRLVFTDLVTIVYGLVNIGNFKPSLVALVDFVAFLDATVPLKRNVTNARK